METVKVNTSQHVDIDYPVAGLGERVGARLIDLALLIFVLVAFIIIFSMTGVLSGNEITTIVLISIYGAGFVFYDLLCEIFMNGQSVGKRLLKIKVISLDGSQPTLGQYFMRWLFRIIDFTLTSQVGALICVAVTENKQRIGDIVAGTTLIKTVPRTNIGHIAFHPVADEYETTFDNVYQLTDRDIELIHEVLNTYYKTYNADLIYQMASKVSSLLSITIPEGVNELDFLKTIITDYSHITSRAV
ncbi:RDD family protein [Pedobacter frigiditerrae]|uniref:RDD family protein n=1 Tax=Pedobacter frigiditerrae TaxID=2530452 RepID=UPI00292E3E29|nr:RDD family protein [Pedobacter frigiditerrae]